MAYSASGGYVSSNNHNYVNLTANVQGSANVRLKTRLWSGPNKTGSYTDIISSGVGAGWHTNQYSVSPNTDYSWEYQAYESGSLYGPFEPQGSYLSFRTPPPPVIYPDQPSNCSTGTPYDTHISFQAMLTHQEGLRMLLQAQLYEYPSMTYVTTVTTDFVDNYSFAFGTFTNLKPGQTYYWYAIATDTNYNNSSPPKGVGTFTTTQDRNPNDPTNLSHTVLTSTTVQFTGKVTDLDGQQLYLKAYVYQDAGLTQQVGVTSGYIGSLTSSGGFSTGTINGLAMAKQYWWTAQTVDNGGAKASSRVYAGTFKTSADWKWITANDANGDKISGANFSMLASEWNSFTGMINQVRAANGYANWPFTVAIKDAKFYYYIFNEAISAINNMQGTMVSPKVSGDTAWAGDFNALKYTLNNV